RRRRAVGRRNRALEGVRAALGVALGLGADELPQALRETVLALRVCLARGRRSLARRTAEGIGSAGLDAVDLRPEEVDAGLAARPEGVRSGAVGALGSWGVAMRTAVGLRRARLFDPRSRLRLGARRARDAGEGRAGEGREAIREGRAHL